MSIYSVVSGLPEGSDKCFNRQTRGGDGFVLPSTTSACHGGVCARASMLDKGSLMVRRGGSGGDWCTESVVCVWLARFVARTSPQMSRVTTVIFEREAVSVSGE